MRWIWILILVCATSHADDLMDRQSRAAFVPRVTLGARSVELAVPGLAARSIEVFAWVRWPLERRLTPGPLITPREARAERASAQVGRRRELARSPAPSLRAQIDELLDAEEADAVLP